MIDKSSVKPNNVIIVIQTDGEENRSIKYNKFKIGKLIDDTKEKGWKYVFLSSDVSSFKMAESIGIPNNSIILYDDKKVGGTRDVFIQASQAVVSLREQLYMQELASQEQSLDQTQQSQSQDDCYDCCGLTNEAMTKIYEE